MKRLSAILLTVCLVVALCSCGQPGVTNEQTEANNAATQASSETTAAETTQATSAQETSKTNDGDITTEEATTQSQTEDDYIPDEEFTQNQLNDATYWVDYRGQGKSFTLAKSVVAGDTSIPEGDTVNDNDWIRYFEAAHGVKPEVIWWASGDAYQQKVSMSIASGDIPDFMEVNLTQIRMLAKADMLADLTSFYDSAINPRTRNAFKEANDKPLAAVTFNGKIQGYPSMQPGGDSGSLVWVRTDWLENLGLEEPATYDDVGMIAKAFAEQDPDGNGVNDTTGMIITSKSYSASYADVGNTGEMFAYFGAFPRMWMTGDDGMVHYGSIMPGALDCLKMLNKWYQDGAIHKEFTSLGDSIFQPIASNQCGIFMAPWWASWSLADSVVNDSNAVWKSYGIARDDGKFYVGMVDPAVNIGVISKNAADPEMIWRLMVIGRPKATIRSRAENEIIENAYAQAIASGLAHSYQPFRVIVSTTIYAVENNYKRIWGLHDGSLTWDDVKAEYEELGMDFVETDYDVTVVKAALSVMERENPYEEIGEWSNSFGYSVGIEPMVGDRCVRFFSEFIGVTETMEEKKAYLDKLEDESYTKMILGETDGKSLDEYFDGFVQEWLSQGGEQITSEVQETIDANK